MIEHQCAQERAGNRSINIYPRVSEIVHYIPGDIEIAAIRLGLHQYIEARLTGLLSKYYDWTCLSYFLNFTGTFDVSDEGIFRVIRMLDIIIKKDNERNDESRTCSA
jgi:hypothetical protein